MELLNFRLSKDEKMFDLKQKRKWANLSESSESMSSYVTTPTLWPNGSGGGAIYITG
jgi:hypothetical protein